MVRFLRIAISAMALAAVLAVVVVVFAGGAVSAPAKVAPVSATHSAKSGPRGPRGPAGPPGPSNAYATYKDGPVSVPSQISPLVTLDIPKAGSYVITAKAWLAVTGPEGGDPTCQLDAHGDLDSTTGFVDPGVDAAVSLEVVHTYTAPSRVDFNCGADTVTTATANWIKIVAIRVGSLTNTKA